MDGGGFSVGVDGIMVLFVAVEAGVDVEVLDTDVDCVRVAAGVACVVIDGVVRVTLSTVTVVVVASMYMTDAATLKDPSIVIAASMKLVQAQNVSVALRSRN